MSRNHKPQAVVGARMFPGLVIEVLPAGFSSPELPGSEWGSGLRGRKMVVMDSVFVLLVV